MFLRILKKDLKDSLGFNCVIFALMLLACVFITIGFTMLYTDLNGEERTYEACNTSDLVMAVRRDIADEQGGRNEVTEILEKYDEITDVSVRETVFLDKDRIVFGDGNQESALQQQWQYLYLSTMPQEMNLVYSINDEPFTVENGCIAIAQHLGSTMNVDEGDHITITTQLGNIYDFEITQLYKSPSAEMVSALILSDDDFSQLMSECPLKSDLYELQANSTGNSYVSDMTNLGTSIFTELGDRGETIFLSRALYLCDDGILNLIVSASLVVVAIFVIAMIFITISFTLKSAIKREEKEIGIMKAMGVYSFSYRALFGVKYIGFAIAGGIIGLPVALLLGNKMLRTFVFHTLYPSFRMQLLLGIMATVCCVLFIVGFVFVSLKRMDRITVMDAIRNDNSKDRSAKLNTLALHRTQKMPVVLFMAISDILKNIRRYIFLMLAYVLGIFIVLFVLQGRDSICSTDYAQRYWQMGKLDFYAEVDDRYLEELVDKTGNNVSAYKTINKTLKENGIDGKVEFASVQNGKLCVNDDEIHCRMLFGDISLDELVISEGTIPESNHEVALSYYHATMYGIALNDSITLEYVRYKEDGVSIETVCEDFTVTAFFEGIGINSPVLFMGKEFADALVSYSSFFSAELNCSDGEYDALFEKMDNLYSDDQIRFIHKDDVVSYILDSYVSILNLLLGVVCTVGIIVFAVLTILYENIFIEEENADIAMLKSMGFDSFSIKMWHALRIALLGGVSVIMAEVMMATLGKAILKGIVRSVLVVVNFEPVVSVFSNYIVVPFAFMAIILIILKPVLTHMDSVQIWRIRNE